MSTFTGLNIAMKGLYATQRSIYVIDHNISNANTVGYSRQVSGQKASEAYVSSDGTGMLGTGVDITFIQRIRDSFLDTRYWNENIEYGEWSVKNSSLSELETIMNESSDNNLTAVVTDFSEALEELSKNTNQSSQETRMVVRQTAESLCKYINNVATTLEDLQNDYNQNVQIKVTEINSYAKQIKDLNEQIYKSELDGSSANDLRDQRTLLLDKLSKIASIEVTEVNAGTTASGQEDIRFQVTINGATLVNHFTSNDIECSENEDGMYEVKWSQTGEDVNFSGGEIKGYIDLRDGQGTNGDYKGIPYYTKMFDTFASTFAKAFNEGIYADGTQSFEGHAGGQGLDNSTGIRFFSFDGVSSEELMNNGTDTDSIYNNITAKNISITSDIQNDLNKIAASSIDGSSVNNEVVDKLISIFTDNNVFAEGTPSDYLSSIISNMGVDCNHASRLSKNQENILSNIDNNRLSVSGVSTEEETANLIKYQQTYNAASKVISVINEILDVTINNLGI